MKKILFLSGTLALLTLQSCQTDNKGEAQNDNQQSETQQPPVKEETPAKMIEQLVGEWQQAAGSANNQQSGDGQKLTFTEEARYIVEKGNQKTDSGAYRMNEQLRNLYFESEANEQPREYEVQLQGDTLILSAKEGNATSQTYIRSN
jgi:hypothetical protein